MLGSGIRAQIQNQTIDTMHSRVLWCYYARLCYILRQPLNLGAKFGATDYRTTSPPPSWKREEARARASIILNTDFPRP